MLRSGVLVRELGDELLMLDTEADRIHRLNPTAAAVWRLHAEGATVEAIALALTERYDVPSELALADVHAMMTKMMGLGLLATEPPTPLQSGSDQTP